MSLRSALGAALVALVVLAGVVPAAAQPKAELDRCVPVGLRNGAISFRTEDHVELPALLLGTGPSGVLLASDGSDSICSWLPLARGLADDGYRVLLYQPRTGVIPTGAYRYDLDVRGAALELNRRGATSTVAGGSGASATAVTATAEKIDGLKGLFLLSPYATTKLGIDLDAVASMKALRIPSLVVAAEDDVIDLQQYGLENTRRVEGARQVAEAASDGRLEIVPGKASGAALAGDAALRDEIRSFIRETLPPPTFVERWKLPISGAVLLALLIAGMVVLRRRAGRNTTTTPDVSG